MERTERMNDELHGLNVMAPASQASLLMKVAQEARLLHLALGADRGETNVARDLERALNDAMDAEPGPEADHASGHLVAVLGQAKALGLGIRAELSDVEIDGALGTCRLPLLSAVLS